MYSKVVIGFKPSLTPLLVMSFVSIKSYTGVTHSMPFSDKNSYETEYFRCPNLLYIDGYTHQVSYKKTGLEGEENEYSTDPKNLFLEHFC